MTLNQIAHYGPVTALCFVPQSPYILAGCGPMLTLFNHVENMVVARVKALSNKIHGIELKGSSVLLYGGRSVSLLPLAVVKAGGDVASYEKAVTDWVVAACFKDEKTVLLLTAHNLVIVWEKKITGTISIPETSILYSGAFGVVNDTVYVFAGTVMSGIYVWQIDANMKGKLVLHLTGHEGSIFGVKPNKNATRLVSCSDDRSIKLWDLSSGENLATGWGHGARIWSLSFFNDNSVMSCSEDCTVRLWSPNLECYRVYQSFSGKSVWCGAVDDTSASSVAAAGGNDGKIKLFDLNESVEAISPFGDAPVAVKYVACVANKAYIAVCADGSFYKVIDKKSPERLDLKIDYQSIGKSQFFVNDIKLTNGFVVVLSSSSKLQYTIVFSAGFKIESVTSTTIEKLGKITGVFHGKYNDSHYFIYESPNPKEPLLLSFFNSLTQSFHGNRFLDKPQTRFVITSHAYYKNKLFLGSRHATFVCYGEENSPLQTWRNILPGDTISQLKSSEMGLWLVLRDGTYLLLDFEFGSDGATLVSGVRDKNARVSVTILSQNRVPRTGFLEGVMEIDEQLFLYGFKSDRFYLYNETLSYEVCSQVCGGAHRFWKYEDSLLFYVREGSLKIKQMTFSNDLLSSGLHGREIRAIDVSEVAGCKIVATGAEDHTVKFSYISSSSSSGNIISKIIPQWTHRRHVSGIQSLRFITPSLLVSCAAREEFFVWKIFPSTSSFTVSWYDELEPSSSHPDLRVMDFASKIKSPNEILLALVYSNSLIRIVNYNISEMQFDILKEWYYKTTCILCCEFINDSFVMVTSTDGCVCVYTVDGELMLSLTVHQNGIRAVCLTRDNDGVVEVITGGDDNALSKVQLEFCATGVKGRIVWHVASAASSTITSISQVSNGVLVTSIDQIVRVWSLDGELKDKIFTTVADTGASAVSGDVALIGGVGLSLLKC